MIELKDFTEGNIENNETVKNKVWELVKKSVDSLQLVLSKKLNTDYFQRFTEENSFDFPDDAELFFITIIHVQESQKEALNFIRDSYRNKFKAYQKLFNLKSTVISRDKAIERFNWVKVSE